MFGRQPRVSHEVIRWDADVRCACTQLKQYVALAFKVERRWVVEIVVLLISLFAFRIIQVLVEAVLRYRAHILMVEQPYDLCNDGRLARRSRARDADDERLTRGRLQAGDERVQH